MLGRPSQPYAGNVGLAAFRKSVMSAVTMSVCPMTPMVTPEPVKLAE